MITKKFHPIIRAITIFSVLVIVYFIVRYLFQYIYPFIIAFFIASFLHPIVSYLETRWHVSRMIATSMIMLLFLGCSIFLSFLLLQQLVEEISTLLSILPTTYTTVNQLLTNLGHTYFLPLYQFIQTIFPTLPPTSAWNLEQITAFFTDKLLQSSMMITQKLLSSLSALITSLSQIMFILLFIAISGFMMTKDYVVLQQYYKKIMPQRFRRFITILYVQLKKSTIGMVKAHFLLALWTSLMVMIGLMIFQFKHVLFMAIFILLIDLIPYVGIGLVFIPWILYQFMIGEYIPTIQLTSLYIVIVILRQFIEPKIIATHIGMHPLVTIILLFIAINMFGLLGVFLTPLMFIAISAIYHTRLVPTVWHYIVEKK